MTEREREKYGVRSRSRREGFTGGDRVGKGVTTRHSVHRQSRESCLGVMDGPLKFWVELRIKAFGMTEMPLFYEVA